MSGGEWEFVDMAMMLFGCFCLVPIFVLFLTGMFGYNYFYWKTVRRVYVGDDFYCVDWRGRRVITMGDTGGF